MLVGLHVHQFPPVAEERLARMRVPFWVVLDNDADYYIPRFDDGKALWVVRLWHPDVPGQDPEFWAGNAIVTWDKWFPKLGDRLVIQYCNEINLGIEHGGNMAKQGFLDSDEGFRDRLDWHMRFVNSLKSRRPDVKIAGPSDSPGHQDIDGRQEVFRYAEAGYYEKIDYFLGHYYAEGPERGGFDAPDRKWYSDRVIAVREMLDSCGYPDLKILVGECNRKQVDVGDVFGEFERYCERIQHAVHAIAWFIHSSPDPAFADMQLVRAPGYPERYQQIIDRFGGNIVSTSPFPPNPEPTEWRLKALDGRGNPIDPQVLIDKYGLAIRHGSRIVVDALYEDLSGGMELWAEGPTDEMTLLMPVDRNPQHTRAARGRTAVIMAASSYGAPGPWIAECGDASVSGLGWIGNHYHVNVRFAHRQVEPVSQPDPAVLRRLELRQYAAWADARIAKDEDPADREAFYRHLVALGVPEPENLARYGWPCP